MHAVVADVIDLDRQEGSGPDMERHGHAPDASGFEPRQQIRREVKPRRGSRHGTLARGENGLVVLGVLGQSALRPTDIGRQRHDAVAVQGRHQLTARDREAERYVAGFALLHHLRRQVGREDDGVADPQPLARLGEDMPDIGALALVEGRFHLDLSPLAGQAGGDHAGVVVDQQVAGVQQVGQVADMPVHQGVAHVQQARGIAWPCRFIGDQLGRQLEVKISGSHEERRYSPSQRLGKGE